MVMTADQIENLLQPQDTNQVASARLNADDSKKDQDSASASVMHQEDVGRPTPSRVNGKRRHEEAINGCLIGENSSIDDLLNNIRQRVLCNETLNNFKKEMNKIVELIEK